MTLRNDGDLSGLGLGGDLVLKDVGELAVGERALGVDVGALLGSGEFADLGGEVELDGGAEDVDNGGRGRGLRNESLEHGGLLGVAAEVVEDELLHGGGAGGLGVDVADVGLGAVIVVLDGGLEHDLLNLDGVVLAALNGSAPPGVAVTAAPADSTPVPVIGEKKPLRDRHRLRQQHL